MDDLLIESLRRPIIASVVLAGCAWAADLILEASALSATRSLLGTIAVAVWALAGLRTGSGILEMLSGKSSIVSPTTQPAFEMLVKIVVVGAAVYLTFLAWDIDLTAWLASAGIAGIALGFAAKDTLANLVAGIAILADAPYALGDWIDLGDGVRGKVTHIGIRSTRILTRNDVEITMPNALIGNSKVRNEGGGPYIQQRVSVSVATAYGDDIDKIQRVLDECPKGIDGIVDHPPWEIRLCEFSPGAVKWDVWVWIDNPYAKGTIQHYLRVAIYKAFQANEIEIPFPQHEVRLLQDQEFAKDLLTPPIEEVGEQN